MHEHADRDHTEPPSTEEGPILPAEFWDKATYTPGRAIDMPAPPAVAIDIATAGMRGLLGINHVHDLTTGTCVRNRYGVHCDAPRRDYQIGGFLPGGVQVARFTDEPTGEDAAALTALADALDTTPEQLAAGPGHDERRHRYATALDLHSFAAASASWQRFVLRVMDVANAEQQTVASENERLSLEVERLREAPFACDTHLCGSCKGCRAANVRDWVTEQSRQIAAIESTLADERARTLAMAERHSEHLHHATERAKTAEAQVARVEALIVHLHTDLAYVGDIRAALAGPEPETTERPAVIDAAHIQRQRDFSHNTFGPGPRTNGVTDHIRRELLEIEAEPHDLNEWVDVAILALDGAWRAGWQPQQIIDAIIAKQTRNEARTWPDWRTADPDCAIEHVRDEPEPCPHTCSCTSDQECPHDCPCEGGA